MSLLSAAALRNRLPTVGCLLSAAGKRWRADRVHWTPEAPEVLGGLLGVDPSEIALRMYGSRRSAGQARDATLAFFGTEVPASWITASRRQPRLSDGGAGLLSPARPRRLDATCDIALLGADPDSGASYLDRCPSPACRRMLGWGVADVRLCPHCGRPLDRPGQEVACAPPEELSGVRFVADLLAPWRGRTASAVSSLPDPLRHLPAVELVSLCLLLPDLGRPESAPRSAGKLSRIWRDHLELASAVETMRAWPGAVGERVEAMRDRRSCRGRFGIHAEYGDWLKHLVRRLNAQAGEAGAIGSAAAAALLDALGRHFAARPTFFPGAQGHLSRVVRDRRSVEGGEGGRIATMSVLLAETGWKQPRLRRLIRLFPETVAREDGRGSGAPVLLHADAVLSVVADVGGALSPTACARVLGLSKHAVRGLVSIGLLPALGDRHLKLGQAASFTALVPARAVADMRSRLAKGASEADGPSVSFPSASARAVVRGLREADLVAAMLDGRLRYSASSRRQRRSGFPYAVGRESLTAVLPAPAAEAPLSLKAFAREFGTTQWTAASLVEAGAVKAIPSRGKHRAVLIAAAEVGRARAELATTMQVADRIGAPRDTSARLGLPSAMRRLGLAPVTGDGGAAGRKGNLVWRTAEVEKVAGRLGDWRRLSGRGV